MNEEKFTGKADLYDKFRPSYPDSLIDFLYENARCDYVADIGAGTGKFTRCLLKKPWRVTAVEPNDDMRAKLSEIGGISVVNASAENTGLADHSAGLVTVAQAFHWFDEELFKAECRRILTNKGKVAVVWNGFIEEGLAERQTLLCRKYSTDKHYSQTGHTGVRSAEAGDDFFHEYFARCEVKNFFGERVFDRESFIGETLSRSHAPNKGECGYDSFINELNELYTEFESNGGAVVKAKTVCFLGSFE